MVTATAYVRKMRGGAQSLLLLCSDGYGYVVKFQNNPQSPRVLLNEFLASRLALAIDLNVPACEIIDVPADVVQGIVMDHGEFPDGYCAGIQFGSRLVGGLMPGQAIDYLPEKQLLEITNIQEFWGMLVFDKWTCNGDGRQAVFSRQSIRERPYTAYFIDHGFCFGDRQDAPLKGTYARNSVYGAVTGWNSFEPWLQAIESIDPQTVWGFIQEIPEAWYSSDHLSLEKLVDRLMARKSRIRELIVQFRESSRMPFPNWR